MSYLYAWCTFTSLFFSFHSPFTQNLNKKKAEYWKEITEEKVEFKSSIGVVLWLLWTVLAIWPKPGRGRKALVIGSLPVLPVVTIYLMKRALPNKFFDDDDDYTFRENMDSFFLLFVAVMQMAMYIRRPLQVLRFQPHKLSNYYSAILANRENMYSSAIITEHAKEPSFNKLGKPDMAKTQLNDDAEEIEERDEEELIR